MTSPVTVRGFRHSQAILVAIDSYDNGVPTLRTPVADAETLGEVLRRDHGFEITILKNEEATQAGLRALLKDLSNQITDDDRIIFYFAGHGIAIESTGGPEGYILPQDADRRSSDKYLSMVELNDALLALRCRHMLVILDCCFAGALRWSSYRDLALAPERLHQERYEWFIRDAAWQAIASAAHDQKAIDVANEQPLGKRDSTQFHSPFAMALIEGLGGSADRTAADGSGDGVITATELYLYLEERLLPRSNSGTRQMPILWPLKKHDKGQFIFLVPGKIPSLPPAPLLDPNANPWRGMQPYEARHSDLFFGRRAATDDLVKRVLCDRLVVVTGASGIGKSSLVRAGLLPRLSDRFRVVTVRPSVPGPTPFASLAEGLNVISAGNAMSALQLAENPHALREWVEEQSGDREFLLVIDQAEELMIMSSEEGIAGNFLRLIASALDRDNPLRIIMTLRSEFGPQFAQSTLKRHWQNSSYVIPQMSQDELRRVIEGPAAVKVMRFESSELVEKLVNEVVQMPGALPLLSFALSQMYLNYLTRHTDDRVLTKGDYESLEGGVVGALRIRANQVVDAVDIAHRQTARRVLERLVSVGSGEFARRRVPRHEFDLDDSAEQARIDTMLTQLDEARLVVSDEIGGVPHLELAHDALIFGWNRLYSWVREDAALIADLRRLTADAESWHRAEISQSVWDDPAQIATIKRLQRSFTPGLSRSEIEFIDASIRRARLNRIARWSAVVALLLATAGALWFAYATEQQRLQSEANRLALSGQLASDLDQALLLAVSSAQLAPGFEGKAALFSAFTRRPQLRRFLHGATGAVSDISFLPNGNVIALSSPDSGAVVVWDMQSPRPRAKTLDGLENGIDEFAIADQYRVLAARRGASLDLYRLKPPYSQAELVKSITINNLKRIYGEPSSASVHAITEGAELVVIDSRTGEQTVLGKLPSENVENAFFRVTDGSAIFKSAGGIWVKREDRWQQLRGPAPDGYVLLDLWIDPDRRQVISGIAVDQNEDAAKSPPTGEKGFRCWYVATGDPSPHCPDIEPIADVASIGFASSSVVFYSTRDLRTGYDRVDYREKLASGWTRDILRLDPTFVTGLTISPDGRTLLVGTVDGEFAEYSLDAFAPGRASKFRDGTPVLLSWDAQGCRLVVLRTNRMDLSNCAADAAAPPPTTIVADPQWRSGPYQTGDGDHIYALDVANQVILWDGHLAEIAKFRAPVGREFSPLLEVVYDPVRREVSVVIDEGSDIWSLQIDSMTWRLLATLPFPIRRLSLAGGKVLADSESDGRLVGLDPLTGRVDFETKIPGVQFMGSMKSNGTGQSVYVAALAEQHSLYRVNAVSGALESGNLNRFSGPAKVLATNGDYFFVEGIGIPSGNADKGVEGSNKGLELWDADRLLPLGNGIRTQGWDIAEFSPDNTSVAIAFSSPPRVAIIPLGVADWIDAACKMAGRDLDDAERLRFRVPADRVCSPAE